MRIIPRLNLNKHPFAITSGELIDATNVMVSKDNAVLQSEPSTEGTSVNRVIKDAIETKMKELNGDITYYKIIYVLPCNTELVIFCTCYIVFGNSYDEQTYIFRYSEETNTVEYCCMFDYNGGTLIGDFTYNHKELIIAVSEYFEDDSKDIPLKTINLGTFGEEIRDENESQLVIGSKHPICPQVPIADIDLTYADGIAYKGWYFVFIRYKISDSTYTQWFNTNKSIYIDYYSRQNILDYWLSQEDTQRESATSDVEVLSQVVMSDSKEICNKTFIVDVELNLENQLAAAYYSVIQLGFICVNKSNTYCYNTGDLKLQRENDINKFSFTFRSSLIEEYAASDMITNYYNYYNCKSLAVCGNKLYIANYHESNKEEELIAECEKIKLTFDFETKDADNNAYDEDLSESVIYVSTPSKTFTITDFYNWEDTTTIMEDSAGNETAIGSFVYYKLDCANGVPYYVDNISSSSIYKQFVCDSDDDVIIRYNSSPDANSNSTSTDTQLSCKAKDVIIDVTNAQIYYYDEDNNRLIKLSNGRYVRVYNQSQSKPNGAFILFPSCFSTTFAISTDIVKVNTYYTLDCLDSISNSTYGIYNFFVHFVDKYGIATKGINISNFNCVMSENVNTQLQFITNSIGNKLLRVYYNDFSKIMNLKVSIDTIPSDYIGCYFSYEKFEPTIKYFGICIGDNNNEDVVYVYSDRFNYDDSITFDFDTIRIFTSSQSLIQTSNVKSYLDYTFTPDYGNFKDYKIDNKILFVADSYNNITHSTRLQIESSEITSVISDYCVCALYNSKDESSYYINDNKTLVPCTKIITKNDIDNSIDIETKTSFISRQHAIIYQDDVYFNSGVYRYQKFSSTVTNEEPLNTMTFICPIEVPMESLQFNNEPTIISFPINGLNTTDENNKSYNIGCVVEAKNTIDLFQQKQYSYYDAYPKTLDWYNPDIYTNNIFDKTIRRSNIIQDESNENSWRYFGTEDYKIISENKGSITKLISIGYYFIAHTQHSMFLFNATNSLQSSDDNKLQLANTDIWDIDYKEVLTSKLGYAGIQKEIHGIVGEFGYIFYDKDSKHIYRYDNESIVEIDSTILNFISRLKDYNLTLVDDKYRDRLMFNFSNDTNRIVLSYNYKTGNFISRHDVIYDFGVSTKENTYYISNNVTDEKSSSSVLVYSYVDYLFSTVSVVINDDYFTMKYAEYLMYNLHSIIVDGNESSDDRVNDYSPVEGYDDIYYAGDKLRVYSSLCDTGDIDVTFDDPDTKINRVDAFAKPRWQYGNWHFNALRNKLADYINGEHDAHESSRLIGNWFVVKFTCNISSPVEYESVSMKLSNGELG